MWQQWRLELHFLWEREVPLRYFPRDFDVASLKLHGFWDVSESAYAGVVYIRASDGDSSINHTALVIAKTKGASIKCLSIPWLELCSTLLVTKLLLHHGKILSVTLESTYAWTDSTVVPSWCWRDPSQFKPFIENWVAEIMDRLPSNRWHHVPGSSNPANCASRGLYPAELANHIMCREGPTCNWLCLSAQNWLSSLDLVDCPQLDEEKPSPPEATFVAVSDLSLLDQISSYTAVCSTLWHGYFGLSPTVMSVRNSR